ncbi:MAG: cell division protein SepF [Candidatus Aenigmatarchaeota archaeon]
MVFDFLKKIFKHEEPLELPAEEEQVQPIYVRIEKLKDFVDIERVAKLVREGNIVFLKTKELQKTDLGEFQNCIQKLKRVSNQYGFDIAGTEEGYIVVTPPFARIAR